jgi:tetratricopeptide (TPR) repeat protein
MKSKSTILFVYLVLGFVSVFFLIFFVYKEQYEKDEKDEDFSAMQEYYLQSDALMSMEKADWMLNEGEYDLAINQYMIALAMDSKNDKIRQQIARAYKAQCILDNVDCENALMVYDFLISEYPYDIPLIKERLELHEHLGDSTGIEEDHSLIRVADLQTRSE